jgi:hypothetical protein
MVTLIANGPFRMGSTARTLAQQCREKPSTPSPGDRCARDGCAERFIRTLKGLEPQSGSRLWVRTFASIEELHLALRAFQRTCNQSWIIERHGYKTPAQVRAEQIGQLPMAA